MSSTLSEIPINSLPRTSGRTIKRLESLDVHTYLDLIHYIPFRYEDYSTIIPIDKALEQEPAEKIKNEEDIPLFSKNKFTIQGSVSNFTNVNTRRRMKLQKVRLTDDSGTIELTWFNQTYLRNIFKPGTLVSVSGFVKKGRGQPQFQPEEYEVVETFDDPTKHTARIVPVYRTTRGISSKTIREKVRMVIKEYGDRIPKGLPDEILKKYDLLDDTSAYRQVHFPENHTKLKKARNRIAFDELFVVQLTSNIIKREWQKEQVGHPIDVKKHKKDLEQFKNSLPFTLTGAQDRSIEEILSDFTESHPMNRLLQGDVGSGKTVVAAAAAYIIYKNGLKTLLMAPTAILAQQHYESLTQTFERLPKKDRPTIALLTSSSKLSQEEVDDADIIVGTHAIIFSKASFDNVGFVVVDEQHKFGVVQRAKLKKMGVHPHLLSMTATPIPRTVTLTVYGELDVSIIDEMPKGRQEITTYVVPPKKREGAYEWIQKQIEDNKTQAFIVCPLIEESESESLQTVKAATVEHEKLDTEIYPDLNVGLLHGRQKAKEKDAIMKEFADHNMDILVSTPVVEVGIDIPNATIIVIEAAERFGMAQLHQLRGRVGRSDKKSYCLLFTEKQYRHILRRLHLFSRTHDGFKLAEYDLEHRGAGNIFGTAQSGISDFQIASLMDAELIEKTQNAVQLFMKKDFETENYPGLHKKIEKYHVKHIARN